MKNVQHLNWGSLLLVSDDGSKVRDAALRWFFANTPINSCGFLKTQWAQEQIPENTLRHISVILKTRLGTAAGPWKHSEARQLVPENTLSTAVGSWKHSEHSSGFLKTQWAQQRVPENTVSTRADPRKHSEAHQRDHKNTLSTAAASWKQTKHSSEFLKTFSGLTTVRAQAQNVTCLLAWF